MNDKFRPKSRSGIPQIDSLPNVLTIPIYSPFRYPGGKSRWFEIAKAWMIHHSPTNLVEPFAGGAHIGLSAAINDWAENVFLTEIDERVSSVWKTIINGDCNWLIRRISSFEISHKNIEKIVVGKADSTKELAFKTIIKNRISRGGLITKGSGRLSKGENGSGIESRWYPDTIIDRIKKIQSVSDKIYFNNGNGFKTIDRFKNKSSTLFFVDPPYPGSGKRLYKHSDVSVKKVFKSIGEVDGHFCITYSPNESVVKEVNRLELEVRSVEVRNSHNEINKELIICDSFSWVNN